MLQHILDFYHIVSEEAQDLLHSFYRLLLLLLETCNDLDKVLLFITFFFFALYSVEHELSTQEANIDGTRSQLRAIEERDCLGASSVKVVHGYRSLRKYI